MNRDWLTIVVVAGGILVMLLLLVVLVMLATGTLPPSFPFGGF